MATVLYYGNDIKIAQILEPFFRNRNEDTGETNLFMQIKDQKGFDEALIAMTFDVIILEQGFLNGVPVDWLASLKRKKSSLKSSFILYGDETDSLKLMKYVESGFTDYLVAPADRPLLIEKIFFYATGFRSEEVRQVYTLQMSAPADIAKPGVLEELSEFECKIRSQHAPTAGEVMILYSSAFGGSTSQKNSVIARCYRTTSHPDFKGQFSSIYSFVGMSPDSLAQIRNALRKSYVSTKPKS